MSELPARNSSDGLSRRRHFGWRELQTLVINDGQELFRRPATYNLKLAIRESFPINQQVRMKFSQSSTTLYNHSNDYVQAGGNQDAGNYPCTSNAFLAFPCANNPVTGQPGFNVIGKQGVVPTGGVPNERRFIQFALRLSF